MTEDIYYLGIDCGSVSLKAAIMDREKKIIWKDYQKTYGRPQDVLKRTMRKLFNSLDIQALEAVVTTGSARNVIAEIMNGEAVNEITTHGLAGAFFYPEAKSIIEIGGQDSKLIILEKNSFGETVIADSAMNDICAAGTGSFLEQQAFRMGISIEELATRACGSQRPAKIAGRCSVFAKTDMIHLQQEGVPVEDLSAGLCEAVVRTYIENLVKSRKLKKQVLFQGGVALNAGMKKAFARLLALDEEEIIVPTHADIMGAIGAGLYAFRKDLHRHQEKNEILNALNKSSLSPRSSVSLPGLKDALVEEKPTQTYMIGKDIDLNGVYLGIDVGSVSAKIAVVDEGKNLVYKYYTETHGDPLTAVKKCITGLREHCGNQLDIKGVGVTGSGRNYIAQFIGADIVKDEITAQAAAAAALVPTVDTIIEIGGQDSKYIRLKNGSITDFVMNKTCAAGTGSFLAEQADRLKTRIEDFSDLALTAANPVDMGTRCTVFIESDLVHYQQNNYHKEDILAGLSYSIAKNYLEKVSGNRPMGDTIVFQGGVAFNKSVVSAFSRILDKNIIISPHHEITGALGIAYLACDERPIIKKSNFIGFNLEERIAERKNEDCDGCSNLCKLTKVKYNDHQEVVYGSICGKFEKNSSIVTQPIPDYFEKRRSLLLSYNKTSGKRRDVIGIPGMLLFHELFPLWSTFFHEIGYGIELSEPYTRQIYEKGLSKILVDTCFPIKAYYGAVENLAARGIEKIFIPYVLDMQDEGYKTKYAHNCQYVQQVPDFIRASGTKDILTFTVRMKADTGNVESAFADLGEQLGVGREDSLRAIRKAVTVQQAFVLACSDMGKQALTELKSFKKIFVLIGHPYIIHDKFFNLSLAKRLAKLGIPTIAADMLPLEEYNIQASKVDLIWKTNNRAVNAVEFIHRYNQQSSNKLLPVLMTTFGCAADSMLTPYLSDILGDNPWLEIEVDEHNSITGILTRCEAFWESTKANRTAGPVFVNAHKYDSAKRTIQDIIREDRTLYIYPVSEAFVGIKDVLENYGVRCEMIAETTPYSNMLGRKYSNEKHCRTYQVILGDYLATTMKESFKPEKSAFFTFEYAEACRLALFKSLHEIVLKERGVGDFWMFGPVVDSSVDWIKTLGFNIARDAWIALICYDYLSRYKYQIRPYEKVTGSADKAYSEALSVMRTGIKNKKIMAHFKDAMALLQKTAIVERDLVSIGVVGDAFTRVHKYGMRDLFEGIEKMGGCVMLPPSWHDFVNYGSARFSKTLWQRGKYGRSALEFGGSTALAFFKNKVDTISKEYSNMFPDQSNGWLTKHAAKYVNPDVAPVIPSMFIGKTVDFVENKHVDGLLNAYGFNCVLGKVSSACYHQLRIDNNNIPMLTFIDDGLQQTNISTRLEAFMDQARAFKSGREEPQIIV